KQNEMNGLSSFASEIIKISGTLARSAQRHLLILIDEPARTTNPIEGKAIVHAIGEMLNRRNSLSLITTHYSGLGLQCRRLRVKGFVESLSDAPLSPATINRFMDYSLLPDDSDDAPQEALRIATILGCDEEMIRLAKQALANANE
ncbi:MAG: DNA mismatch repair protein MutS, partial [Bacteroidales bacterium]|nr:DNA mismatch repair protein MutS [Bacteroidales bacterium]